MECTAFLPALCHVEHNELSSCNSVIWMQSLLLSYRPMNLESSVMPPTCLPSPGYTLEANFILTSSFKEPGNCGQKAKEARKVEAEAQICHVFSFLFSSPKWSDLSPLGIGIFIFM